MQFQWTATVHLLPEKTLTPSKLASRARVRMGHLPACFRHTESRTCDLVSIRLLEMTQKESWQARFRIVSSVFLDEETRPRHHPLRTIFKNPVKETTTYRPRMLSMTHHYYSFVRKPKDCPVPRRPCSPTHTKDDFGTPSSVQIDQTHGHTKSMTIAWQRSSNRYGLKRRTLPKKDNRNGWTLSALRSPPR